MINEDGDKLNATGIIFNDGQLPDGTLLSCLRFGVYDPETGALIGITVKLGSEPVMMIPVAPIPPGAVRFDEERST